MPTSINPHSRTTIRASRITVRNRILRVVGASTRKHYSSPHGGVALAYASWNQARGRTFCCLGMLTWRAALTETATPEPNQGGAETHSNLLDRGFAIECGFMTSGYNVLYIVAFGTSPMLDRTWCCASGAKKHLDRVLKNLHNQEEHISTITPRPNLMMITNPDSDFKVRLQRHCHFTPPASPIVACGNCLNPLPRTLGSMLAVAGVIFPHDISIEKSGAFSGVMTLSLA